MTSAPTTPDPLVNEIRMLLDFVTGSSVQTLKDLVIPNPDVVQSDDKPTVTLRNTEILNRLNDIETQLTTEGAKPLSSHDRSFLQLLRDALGAMVRPATGLTIAYSSMVVGRQRGRYDRSRTHPRRERLSQPGRASVPPSLGAASAAAHRRPRHRGRRLAIRPRRPRTLPAPERAIPADPASQPRPGHDDAPRSQSPPATRQPHSHRRRRDPGLAYPTPLRSPARVGLEPPAATATRRS